MSASSLLVVEDQPSTGPMVRLSGAKMSEGLTIPEAEKRRGEKERKVEFGLRRQWSAYI